MSGLRAPRADRAAHHAGADDRDAGPFRQIVDGRTVVGGSRQHGLPPRAGSGSE